MSVTCILVVCALVSSIISAMGKCPLFVPVLLLSIAMLLGCVGGR